MLFGRETMSEAYYRTPPPAPRYAFEPMRLRGAFASARSAIAEDAETRRVGRADRGLASAIHRPYRPLGEVDVKREAFRAPGRDDPAGSGASRRPRRGDAPRRAETSSRAFARESGAGSWFHLLVDPPVSPGDDDDPWTRDRAAATRGAASSIATRRRRSIDARRALRAEIDASRRRADACRAGRAFPAAERDAAGGGFREGGTKRVAESRKQNAPPPPPPLDPGAPEALESALRRLAEERPERYRNKREAFEETQHEGRGTRAAPKFRDTFRPSDWRAGARDVFGRARRRGGTDRDIVKRRGKDRPSSEGFSPIDEGPVDRGHRPSALRAERELQAAIREAMERGGDGGAVQKREPPALDPDSVTRLERVVLFLAR